MKEGLTGKKRSKKGQSTLELLVAMVVIILSVSAVIAVSFGNQLLSLDTELSNTALLKAKEMMEDVRADARENFTNVVSSTEIDGDYTKELIVTDVDNYEKRITVRVSWQTDPLREQKVELETIITDWKTSFDEGGGTGLTGEWQNPRTAGTIDLGPGNSGNDLAVIDGTVFIVADASDSKKSDFYSINVTNIDAPSERANINTGKGLSSISLMGDYAYVTHLDNSDQLQVIDISNVDNPSFVGSVSFQANNKPGKSIFALDGYIYVGSESSSGAEFQIFDASVPSNPSFVTSVEIGADVNDIYVFRNWAYLATSITNSEIMIFDISDPLIPTQIASFNYPNTPGLSVFSNSFNYFYTGIDEDFIIIDSTDLETLSIIGSYDANGLVNDIYMRDRLGFLASSNANQEFHVVDVINKALPVLYASYNFPQVCTGIAYRDNVVYVSARSNDALRIITSQ